MLIFGHTGLTLGAAVLFTGALSGNCHRAIEQSSAGEICRDESALATVQNCARGGAVSWLSSLGRHIDIRLLLIASILPDLVDKPLGVYIFRETFSSGRIFCHTLLLLVLITIAGIWLYRSRGQLWLMVISFGFLTHLIFDRMWGCRNALWPAFGLAFEREDLTDWEAGRLTDLVNRPDVYVPEIIGGIVLLWFFWVLLRNRSFWAFIKSGRVS